MNPTVMDSRWYVYHCHIRVGEQALPTLNKLAVVLEQFTHKYLGEVICSLQIRSHFVDTHVSIFDILPKEMPLDMEVLGAGGDALIGGKQECSVVVFEHTGMDAGAEGCGELQGERDFNQERADWEQGSHTLAESGVFGFESRKRDFGLKLRLPNQGATA